MVNELTIAYLMMMITDDRPQPERTPRAFKESRPKMAYHTKKQTNFYKSKKTRRYHNIKQPGFDVQRR